MKNEIQTIVDNFNRKGFRFSYYESAEEAVKNILSLIPAGSSIGFGGSVTVKESGLLDALIQSDSYTLYHRELRKDVPADELYKIMHGADWFICSANALIESGEILNIDGRGNRVAATLNGPKNVVFICGVNKLVSSIDEGIYRTHNVASPLNAKRLGRQTPCAFQNKCVDCNSPDRMCNATVILHRPTSATNVYVALINQNLGY